MQHNPVALANKEKYLDVILAKPDLILAALNKLGIPGTWQSLSRIWSPGGGSSLFKITSGGTTYFMKAKHISVTVESKLEAESAFILLPSLKNEYDFLQKYQTSPHVPKVIGYTELSGFSFLIIESLTRFDDSMATLSPEEIITCYQQLKQFVRQIFANQDIHTDLHEKNIMFREKIPVIVDWEEARHLPQTTDFANSLDVKGYNYLGNTGQTPMVVPNMIAGHPCLNKLKNVFQNRLKTKISQLASTAAYNSATGICRSLDHGLKSESYQTIKLPGLWLPGQRPARDLRLGLVKSLLTIVWGKQNITFIDIGSNLGTLTRAVSQLPFVQSSRGIEGVSAYNRLARLLNFIDGNDRTEFYDLTCGNDDITPAITHQSRIVYGMLSVYHHIEHPDQCLTDLASSHPIGLIIELAQQPECYQGRTWQQTLKHISERLNLPYVVLIGYSPDYFRPFVVLSAIPFTPTQKLQLHLVGEMLWPISWWQRLIRYLKRHLISAACLGLADLAIQLVSALPR
ncbi:MAG: phosphotransferase [Patescibacteria group bacterium]|jgi:hypothetical protein